MSEGSDVDGPDWAFLVEQILLAPDELGAHVAATLLVDEALPGGSILHEGSPKLFEALRGYSDFVHQPNRLYVLAALNAIAHWMRRWRRIQRTRSADVRVQAGVAVEEGFERCLRDFCNRALDLFGDPDAEVRSAYYRMYGHVSEPQIGIRRLNDAVESEQNNLAAACAVEGMILALLRCEETASLWFWAPTMIQAHLGSEIAMNRVLAVVQKIVEPEKKLKIEEALELSGRSVRYDEVARWRSEAL